MPNVLCKRCGWIHAAHAQHTCTIRDVIAAEIARAGWTQRELAKRAGITQPQLSRYLRTGKARTELIERLLAVLGLEIVKA
jgi:transcriptional regulator with XRE-family HTH domain